MALAKDDFLVCNGRCFGLAYYHSKEHDALLRQVASHYYYKNEVSPTPFPSVERIHQALVTHSLNLFKAREHASGCVTSGATESNYLVIKAYRDKALSLNKKGPFNIVTSIAAHPSLFKAAQALGVAVIKVHLQPHSFTVDAEQLLGKLNANTILVVLHAPSYLYGVCDPISMITEMTAKKNIPVHIDAAIGGLFYPFMQEKPKFSETLDLNNKGVSSICFDFHKYGYSLHGAAMLLYQDAEDMTFQYFTDNDYCGVTYLSETFLGSRSLVPSATALASYEALYPQGFFQSVEKIMMMKDKLCAFIESHPHLDLVLKPEIGMIAITSKTKSIQNIQEKLHEKKWFASRIQQPEALHIILTPIHEYFINDFIEDLDQATIQAETEKIQKRAYVYGKKDSHSFDKPDILKISQSIETILQDGGDVRIELDPQTQLGKYGTRLTPKENVINFSSCTANNITQTAYTKACQIRDEWLKFIDTHPDDIENMLTEEYSKIKSKILALLGIEQTHDIVLSPSGTDAEYIANYLIHSLNSQKRIINIVISPLEIGNGSIHAASDRYFSIKSPNNTSANLYEKIRQPNIDKMEQISLRDEEGNIKTQNELFQELHSIVKQYDTPNTVIIVHSIDSSKTGIGGPTMSTITQLEESISHAQVYRIIDAAQLRIAKENIMIYSQEKSMIIITGSKFIGGPPFCGAVLVPKNISLNISEPLPAQGLNCFFNHCCFSKSMRSIANQFPLDFNIGLLMRWLLAIDTMEQFYQLNTNDIEAFLNDIYQAISRIFSHYPDFILSNNPPLQRSDKNHYWDEIPTIYTFEVIHPGSKEKLNYEALYSIYKILNQQHNCCIGQPVKISTNRATLRLALSAQQIIEYKDNKEILIDQFAKTIACLHSIVTEYFKP